MAVDVNHITAAPSAGPPAWWWRFSAVQKLRTDPRRAATPSWVATELLYRLTNEHRDWVETIFVVEIVGGVGNGPLAAVSSPGHGRRIVRLRYDWETEIAPWLHLPPRELSRTRLAELAGFGWLLRARVRAAMRSK